VDFRHFRAFVAVADERNFTRAAQRLHISQPPLTRQIRQLEAELGVTLFLRHRTGVELTSEGRALLDKARSVMTSITDFESSARWVKAPRNRGIAVGVSWGLWEAVNLIRTLHTRRFPEVAITAYDLCDLTRPVAEREIDIAILRPPLDSELVSEKLFEEQVVAMLAETHPLASRKSVTLADLANEPLLLFERRFGPGVYDKIVSLCDATCVKPVIVEGQPLPYTQTARSLVASRQGFCFGVASQFTQTHRASGISIVPLNEVGAQIDIRIAWRRSDSNKQIREFVRSAREVFPLKRHTVRSFHRSAGSGSSRLRAAVDFSNGQ
jgi:DNA-binding transcriptional LysR family regulator